MKFWQWFCWSIKRGFPEYLTALFTLALAVFACYAWVESQRGTRALEGQLMAMKSDQRPFLWITTSEPPRFLAGSGQIVWNVQYANFGKGIAYNSVVHRYLKVGPESYQIHLSGDSSVGVQNPPGKVDFFTIVSRPGYSPGYFDQLLAKDGELGFLLEFTYTDSAGQEQFFDALCMDRLATGAMQYRNPKECRK